MSRTTHCLHLLGLCALFAFVTGTARAQLVSGSRLEITNAGSDATFMFGNNLTSAYYSQRYHHAAGVLQEFVNNGTETQIASKAADAVTYYPRLFLDKDLIVQGKIGVGTSSPLYKLHVETPASVGFLLYTRQSTVTSPAIDLLDQQRGVETVISSTDATEDGTYIASYSNHPLLFGTRAGVEPTAKMKLMPNGDLIVRGNSNFVGDAAVAETDWTYTTASGSWQVGVNHLGRTGNQFFIWNNEDSKYHFVVQRVTGNVGIGVTDPAAEYKLAVEGTIGARKMKVTQETWADFVFKPGYRLPSLEEVEGHIREKGHLPGIPSEKDVARTGIDLGDMDTKLLQKIEELTLYLIAQKKEIEALKAEVRLLKQ